MNPMRPALAARLVLGVVALAALPAARAASNEARVSLDAKDVAITDVVRVLAEAGGFQVVFDPGIDCRLTLKLDAARWRGVLDAALAACRLGVEEEADVLRVAPVARLSAEASALRDLEQQRAARPSGRLALFHLSYARAREVAPLLARMLPPSGRVSWDERTNTLLVAY
jgi:type II secretory pathway component HofQ